MSDYIALISLVVGCLATYYAWRAYSVTRELSFPKKDAHRTVCYLREMSKAAVSLNSFLHYNVDKRVYLNVHFDSEEIVYQEFKPGQPFNVKAAISIWIENFKKLEDGQVNDSSNSTSLYLQISDDFTHHLYWESGGYCLKGYFAVLAHGAKQGQFGALLKPLQVN